MEKPKAIITQIDVNSRGIAADICEKFEELLDKYDITIPDEYREGDESEARIYGEEWDTLVTEISYIITDLVAKIKENRKAKIVINQDKY